MKRLADNVESEIDQEGFGRLTLTTVRAARAAERPYHHRDPFDRLLIAQALTDGLVLVSNETLFDSFAVSRLWD